MTATPLQLGLSATVSRTELLEKLELAALVKPLRLLAFGALLEAREGSLVITCDNLEILVRVEVPANVEHEGSTTFSAERLRKLLDNSDGHEVTLRTKDEKSLEVTCGSLASTLACGSAADFPRRPTNPVQASFEVPNLRDALTWLSPAVVDDSQHQGVHFFADGKTLRLEAIDGRQLHAVMIESSGVADVTAPPSLVKLGKTFESDGECTVEVTERSISFRTGKIFVCTSLLEDKFPDTAPVIPESSGKLITLPKSALESALKAASAVLEKNIGPGHVDVSVKPDVTTIRTPRCVAGSVETVIAAPNSHEIAFQISPARLLAAIKHVGADEVKIQCEDPLRSACIRHGVFLALIATMHVP